MNGQQIYQLYQEKRDYTGSQSDAYAQELETMYMSCFLNGQQQEFYDLLKNAHSSEKKLQYKDGIGLEDFYTFEDITIGN